jgi:hypothetical protein
MAPVPEFTFDPRSGRYREAGGRFVAESRVRSGVDAAVGLSSDRMATSAAQLRADEITVERFQAEMLRHVKEVHVANALAAHGGRAQMTPSRWGYVGARIRSEYGYVRGMVSDVIDGRQPLNRRLDARARQYAQAGAVTYEAIQAREATSRGQTEERNVLHAAESCSQCRTLAAAGWVALGTLPPVGARICRGQCRCTIARRGAAASEAA